MSRFSVTLFLAGSLLCATSASAALRLRLSVEPASELPGIYPTLRVVATNDGPATARVPNRVLLKATRSDGTCFWAYVSPRGQDVVSPLYEGKSVGLAPQESRDLSFWSGPDDPIWFAQDVRLWKPGPYQLQLVMKETLENAQIGSPADKDTQAYLADAMASNVAEFTVRTPEGDDAKVWEAIRDLSSPLGWREKLADFVIERYPAARYAGFVVAHPAGQTRAAERQAFEAAVARNPDAPIADWFRLTIAQDEADEAYDSVLHGLVDEAVAMSRKSWDHFAELARQTRNPRLRAVATAATAQPPRSRATVERAIQALTSPVAEVTPNAVCAVRTPSGADVWFSYSNPTERTLTVPVGNDNRFTPPPFDRGQGVDFFAGYAYKAFKVRTTEPELTWHLQKTNLHVMVKDLPNCADVAEP